METKTFVMATNGRLKWWLHHTLEDLSLEQLHYRTPLVGDRPIAEVAMHAAVILLGNAFVAAGKHWSLEDYPLDGWPPRLARPDSAAALVAMLDTMLAQVDELVQQIPAGALDKEVTFPWGQQQAGDALSAGLVHALTHAGAIEGIRALGGFPVPPGY
jgi:DinB superfamily